MIPKHPPLSILVAVTALGPLALNIFIPSMPGMQAVFNTDYATIQLTLTLYLASTAVAQLFLGALSDRFGRRPIMLAGLILFLIASIIATAATSISLLIAARMAQAVGGCTGLVLGRAIVRDMHDQDSAASQIAYITMAMVIAPMIAPALGGYLDVFAGWRASFVVVAVAGAIVLVWAWSRLHETHFERQAMPSLLGLLISYFNLLKSPLFCSYTAVLSFGAAMFFSFIAGAPYIMVNILHQAPSHYGLYFVLVSIGYMLGNFIAGRLSKKLGVNRMVGLGCLIALLGTFSLLGFALSGVLTPLTIFGPMTIIAISNGLSLPNSTSGAISVNPRMTGTASGLAGFFQVMIGALATWIVGALQDDTQMPMIFIMLGASFIAFAAYLFGILLPQRRLATL